jgi:hypothetical protein
LQWISFTTSYDKSAHKTEGLHPFNRRHLIVAKVWHSQVFPYFPSSVDCTTFHLIRFVRRLVLSIVPLRVFSSFQVSYNLSVGLSCYFFPTFFAISFSVKSKSLHNPIPPHSRTLHRQFHSVF